MLFGVRALVKTHAGPGLELKDVPEPQPGPTDVKIRVLRAGLCGTDLHLEQWDDWAASTVKAPMTIGHEFYGEVVEVALEVGAKASYRVDDASEIDEAWLEGVDKVSVTSGASVPEDLVDGVLAFLSERGYPDAQAVHTAEESLIFALPPELRRDLRAAARA